MTVLYNKNHRSLAWRGLLLAEPCFTFVALDPLESMPTAELTTIRALSQYRPFEGGGASVRDAHADLLLAALAEAGGDCSDIDSLRDTVNTLFRIELSNLAVANALNQLIAEGRIAHVGRGFALVDVEATRLEAISAESQAIADEALAEWRKFLAETWTLSSEQIERLTGELALFLRTVMRRHGAEASLLLYPESERSQTLFASIEEEGFDFLPRSEIADIRGQALSTFIRSPTDAQKVYLAQNLNTAYFLTVLSIDPDGARLVLDLTRNQRVYLDTNFLYRLLGVQGPRFVKPAEAILRATQSAGYQVAITPWTLDEFQTSVRRSREFLERYPIPPGEYAAVAAEATADDNFVSAYWRQVRGGVKIQDFFDYYAEIETHVRERGIDLVPDGCRAVDAQTDEITDQMSILAKASHGRYRHPATLEHDVKHRMLVRRLRGQGNRTFSNAGYWFLTHDSVLPRYDYHASDAGELAFCVSAGAWFQITEAFRPKTKDPEQSLADMLASPYIRYRRPLSQRTALEIVGRVDQYEGGSPELAARVMMNSAVLEEIEEAESDDDRIAKIDNAIVAAAREAQDEAREARELAEQERQRADEAARQAQQRAAAAELKAAEAIAAAEAARRIELAGAEARAADTLASTQERHQLALDEKEKELRTQRTEAKVARRRLLFFASLVIAVVAFFLLDLAVGLRSAWSVLIAVGVLIALALGISQWARWHSDAE
jgi:VIT1/CCC1 family predicted Fe2+/Mn2+ transporter